MHNQFKFRSACYRVSTGQDDDQAIIILNKIYDSLCNKNYKIHKNEAQETRLILTMQIHMRYYTIPYQSKNIILDVIKNRKKGYITWTCVLFWF